MTGELRHYYIIKHADGRIEEQPARSTYSRPAGATKIARAITEHGTFDFVGASLPSTRQSTDDGMRIWHLEGQTTTPINGKPGFLWRLDTKFEFKMEFSGPPRTVSPNLAKILDTVDELVFDEGWCGSISNAVSDARQDVANYLECRDTVTVPLHWN